MSAKEMFEELGYECFDDRDNKEHLPLTIIYRKEYKDMWSIVEFDLPDKRWHTKNRDCEVNNYDLLQAINKQIEELGWSNE